jgi:hypothetical protein
MRAYTAHWPDVRRAFLLAASEPGHPIAPVLLRQGSERCVNAADQNTELLLADAVRYQKHAGVLAIQARPGNEERHKVSNVAGNEQAAIVGGKVEEFLVAESFQVALFIDRPDVVSQLAKRRSHALPGDVGIQE